MKSEFEKIPGVGPKIAKYISELGFREIADLKKSERGKNVRGILRAPRRTDRPLFAFCFSRRGRIRAKTARKKLVGISRLRR